MKTNKKCPKYVDPSGALPNLGVTGTAYVTSGGVASMKSPPHASLRAGSIPPGTPGSLANSRAGSEFFRQGSPQSAAVGGNKISIPKAVIDRVADLEKEREKEEKDALVVRMPSKMFRKYS